jgi:hypothetical protein
MNYLPSLALNLDPPDFSLLSSWDYRCEPPVPGLDVTLLDAALHLCPSPWPCRGLWDRVAACWNL